MSSEQLVIYFHTQLTMDNKHVNMHIPSDPKAHLSLFNHIKFETPITDPRALIELTSQNPLLRFPSPPLPRPLQAQHSQAAQTFGDKRNI